MRTIRWGMIGCGDVAEKKSGPGFYKARNSELRAVMRRNGVLAADYARRHGVARWHDDADAIIEADDIDAVYIATLTDSHREYTLRCAAAGKPVYVEKPMGMDHAQCVDMVAACRAANVPLWVGYYRRALPRFLAVRDLVAAGAIGDVRMAVTYLTQRLPDAAAFADGQVPWRMNPRAVGRGLLLRVGCHTFDFLDFLFGPDRRRARLRRQPGGPLRDRGRDRGHLSLRVRRATAAARGATRPTATRSTPSSSARPGACASRLRAGADPRAARRHGRRACRSATPSTSTSR